MSKYQRAADMARQPDGSVSASRFIANCDAADRAGKVALVFPDHVIMFPDETAAKEYVSAMFGHLEEAYTSLDWSIKPVQEP